MQNIKVVATISVEQENALATELALQQAVVASLKEKGCKQYQLHRSKNHENTFVMLEIWESQTALDRHSSGDAFQALISALGAAHAKLHVMLLEEI